MSTIIIQARLGSTRLPRKVEMMLPNGKRIIDTLICSALESNAENVVLVTPDAELAESITACPVYVWGGERDVLGEFWFAAKDFEDDIVRLTGDCPLLTPEIISYVINEYIYQEVDYVCNTHDDSPVCDGYDVEVFSFNSLKEAHEKATTEYEREHVTPYIRDNFRTEFCVMPELEGCSIDTYEDYIKVCELMENNYGSTS
jgi:spore coat polysaccharide biosynthesis protein SpsF (cytidylyltransferase family)